MTTTVRSLALAIAVAILAGCSGRPDLTGPDQDMAPSHLLSGTVQGALLSCLPMPYQMASSTIGSAGGTVQVGPHTLVIPRGALKRSTRITAEIPGDGYSSVRFGPEGLRFAKSASLTLSYAHCQGLGVLLPKKIAYTTELLSILEILRSTDDVQARTVSAPLDHFSRYAVAY